MSGFADRLTVRYLDAAAVKGLLAPAGDAAHRRLRSLLTSVYAADTLVFETVDDVVVRDVSFQVPIAAGRTTRGSWERMSPSPERTLMTLEAAPGDPLDWIDLALQTSVAVQVSGRGAVLESATPQPATMRPDGGYDRDYRLHYADPPPFVPGEPEFARSYPLRVCALFFATADLVGSLRRLVAARREVDRPRLFGETHEGGSVRSSAAWLAVFDGSAVPAAGTTRDDIGRLFAAEDAVATFETA